jgi:hypothetical protein
VASSAVVGSSASSKLGAVEPAIAISTRCRIPPESSCGYWRSLCSGAVMCTKRKSSTSRSRNPWPPDVAARRQHLAQLIADGKERIEGRHRILQDHRDLAAAQLPQLARPTSR